jgi:biopolymer transport protein TolR
VRRRARQRLSVDVPELNLVPLLDMVSLLIQLMLINARFGLFAEIGSFAARPSGEVPTGASLGLVVRVNLDGYEVSWADGEERVHQQLACATTPCLPDDYATDALRGMVVPLKQRFPDETRVVVVPMASVPFEVLVATMDTLREPVGNLAMFDDVMFPPAATR